MLETVSAQEIVWTTAALVGVGLRLRALRDSWLDRQAVLEVYSDGAKETLLLVANASLRGEAIGLIVKSMFVFVGIYYMFVGPNRSTGGSAAQWVLAGAFVFVIVLMNINSFLGARTRTEIRELEESKQHDKDEDS